MQRERNLDMENMARRIQQRKTIISVVGLGYVGLPIVVELLEHGYTVVGIDSDLDKIDELNKGISYIKDVPNEKIKKHIGNQLKVDTRYANICIADIIMICLPTPLDKDKNPDISCIKDCVQQLIRYMKKGAMIILESTSYPGTTQQIIADEITKQKEWKIGIDFYTCYSPERVDPGNTIYNVSNTPKVVSGVTEQCLEYGVLFYKTFVETVVQVHSTKIAELSKLIENTYRCVNIACINEIMMMAQKMDIDIWEAIKAADTKPFGFQMFVPGPGVGGHCIPLDPMYLSWIGKKENYYNRFIELSMDINSNMPQYVVTQIIELLSIHGKGINKSHIMLLGMAYKKDSSDIRESPSLEIYRMLQEKGAAVSYHDPYVLSMQYDQQVIYSTLLEAHNLKKQDLVVVVTDHTNIDYKVILDSCNLIYDTRNVYDGYKSSSLYYLGEKLRIK